jgi:hypothetical protein
MMTPQGETFSSLKQSVTEFYYEANRGLGFMLAGRSNPATQDRIPFDLIAPQPDPDGPQGQPMLLRGPAWAVKASAR